MTTQYTPILKLALPVTGELSGTWGDVVNDNITSMVEQAIAGLATISTWSANAHTLSTANGTTSESRCAMLVAQGGSGGSALTGAGEIVCPASSKLYVLQNGSAFQITLKTASGTGVAVAAGETAFLFCDGTNVNSCVTTIVDGHITGNLTVDGNATVNGNTTLGNATSDTITATARFASGLIPSADNTYDLGSTANSWKDLYIDGTATMALVAISGGTIDGVSIGATTPATIINVDNLSLNGNTISSTDTNGNIVIAPNGTGDVRLDADTVRVGDAAAAVTLTSNGAGALTVTTGGAADLTLSTNSGTTSGTITIANGANGNITLTPNGTGDVILSADTTQIGDSNTDAYLTTNGTGNLNLTTNNGTNSGTIQIAQGANGNITLTPNGTGSVSVPKLVWSNGTATRVPYLTTGGQFTDDADMTFDGTTLTVGGLSTAGSVTLSGGTANGVAYLNGSKVLTTGSALVFDSQNLGLGTASPRVLSDFTTFAINNAGVNGGLIDLMQAGTVYGSLYLSKANNKVTLTGGTGIDLVFEANGSEQMRLASSLLTVVPGATIQGITVGRGAGAVSANTAVGASALAANTSGNFNVAVGANAAANVTTVANMVAVGYGAVGTGVATGTYVTAVGTSAGKSLTSGSYNTAVGTLALQTTSSGSYNTAIGVEALQANTTAFYNTAIGHQAGYTASTASEGTYIGYQAAKLVTGSYNVAIGSQAMQSTTTATDNVAVGTGAMQVGVSGSGNIAVGSIALKNNTGSYNVALGYYSLGLNTSGSNNTAVGVQALFSNQTANTNTAVGYQAGYSNTTGPGQTLIGYTAGYAVTTGTGITALGYQAGKATTTNSYSTFVGYSAGLQTTGGANVMIGSGAGQNLSTGSYNTFVGNNATLGAGANVTGDANVTLGYNAGYYMQDAANGNTFLGTSSGDQMTTGSKNTILGRYNGNQGGLDIRTANNYVVLSDGDGNPRYWNRGGIEVMPFAFQGAFVPNSWATVLSPVTSYAVYAEFIAYGYENGLVNTATSRWIAAYSSSTGWAITKTGEAATGNGYGTPVLRFSGDALQVQASAAASTGQWRVVMTAYNY